MTCFKTFAAAIALAVSSTAAAQEFPSKLITIVVPFPPGGSTDLIARKLADKFQQSMKQAVIVENKPGAGGAVGSAAVAGAAPDGHTVMVGVTGSHGISVSLNPKLPYHPLRDFAPISMLTTTPLTVVVNPSVPAKDLKSLVALGKPFNHGTPGNGTSMHLTAEMFNLAAGTRFVHVPYKGTAAAINDLIGGQIELMFADFAISLPQVKAGKIKPLAVTSLQRHPFLPDVPTVAESGYPGFEALSWQGLFAPAGTPPAVVTKLNAEVVKALSTPDMRDYFASQGFVTGGDTPAQFRAFIEREIPKWARIIKEANVTVQ
jgi:tripartite-type tricarboxylate transporter receptor subunit TctC